MSTSPPLASDSIHVTASLAPTRGIGSFWRRLIAFSLDAMIVGIVGTVIALPFFQFFSRLGPWGRLVGFCLVLPYFAILNSKIGTGQTLGKRWMRLRVVDKDGDTISFRRSLVRYFLFAVPFFVNQLLLPVTRTPWIITLLLSLLIFGLGGAIVYLVIFNRRTRQGIHDLAAGSYVTRADQTGPVNAQTIWKQHWIILGSLLTVFALCAGILSSRIARWGPFPQLIEDARLIESMKEVQAAGVQDATTRSWGSQTNQKILIINIFWTGKKGNEEAFADQVATVILKHDPRVQDHDLFRIVLVRGYDLGIAHAEVKHFYEHTPADWNTRLFGSSSLPSPTALF